MFRRGVILGDESRGIARYPMNVSDKSTLGKAMASDDKKTKTSSAPENEAIAKKKDEKAIFLEVLQND